MPQQWTKEEEDRLIQAVKDHTDENGTVNWGRVSNTLDRSVSSVKTKWALLNKERRAG